MAMYAFMLNTTCHALQCLAWWGGGEGLWTVTTHVAGASTHTQPAETAQRVREHSTASAGTQCPQSVGCGSPHRSSWEAFPLCSSAKETVAAGGARGGAFAKDRLVLFFRQPHGYMIAPSDVRTVRV